MARTRVVSAALLVAALLVLARAPAATAATDATAEFLSEIADKLSTLLDASDLTELKTKFATYFVAAKSLSTLLSVDLQSASDVLKSSLSTVLEESTATVEGIISDYCTKPEFVRGGIVPAVFHGPELNVTLGTGDCVLEFDLENESHSVVCTSPSVEYTKAPASFVHTHYRPDVVVLPNCNAKKAFGNSSVETLFSLGDYKYFATRDEFVEYLQDKALGAVGIGSDGSSPLSGWTFVKV